MNLTDLKPPFHELDPPAQWALVEPVMKSRAGRAEGIALMSKDETEEDEGEESGDVL